MKRVAAAGVVGGLIVFAWSAVSWTALPFHAGVMKPIPDGEAVASAMRELSAWLLVRGLLLSVAAAIVAAALLAAAAPALPRYRHRVLFVALLGGFAATATRLVDWNWWAFPLDWILLEVADLVVGWTLAGLAIAAIVRLPVGRPLV